MNTITINVSGEQLEILTVELTEEEVRSLYNLRKDLSKKVDELTKEIDNIKKNNEYTRSNLDTANSELTEGHTLLTALGVKDKTDHEESYYRKDLKIATRIALYIANNK